MINKENRMPTNVPDEFIRRDIQDAGVEQPTREGWLTRAWNDPDPQIRAQVRGILSGFTLAVIAAAVYTGGEVYNHLSFEAKNTSNIEKAVADGSLRAAEGSLILNPGVQVYTTFDTAKNSLSQGVLQNQKSDFTVGKDGLAINDPLVYTDVDGYEWFGFQKENAQPNDSLGERYRWVASGVMDQKNKHGAAYGRWLVPQKTDGYKVGIAGNVLIEVDQGLKAGVMAQPGIVITGE